MVVVGLWFWVVVVIAYGNLRTCGTTVRPGNMLLFL